MNEYVVGFAFDTSGRVAMIKKNRPEWQAGLLNGIGGKVEKNDQSPGAAMAREFKEETGVMILDWTPLLTMTYPADTQSKNASEVLLHFFYAEIAPHQMNMLKKTTDEEIMVLPAHVVSVGWYPMVSNLSWILPLAAYYQKAKYMKMEVNVLEFNGEGV